MLTNLLFKLLIVLAVGIAIVFTVQEAVATTLRVPEMNTAMECASLPSHYSIHSEYVTGVGRVTYTEDGPTGQDGG